MDKKKLIPKKKYVRRRTVDGKKIESIMECMQITTAGAVFFQGGNLVKLTDEQIKREVKSID